MLLTIFVKYTFNVVQYFYIYILGEAVEASQLYLSAGGDTPNGLGG